MDIFQYKKISEHSSTNKNQSVRICQRQLFSQEGYSSKNDSVSMDIPVQMFSQKGYSSTKYSVSQDIPVGNIQSGRIFQYLQVVLDLL
jgi:hypothetical protein